MNYYNKKLLPIIKNSKRIYVHVRLANHTEIKMRVSKAKALEIFDEYKDTTIFDYVEYANGDLLLGY